jgi:hypothetical protein
VDALVVKYMQEAKFVRVPAGPEAAPFKLLERLARLHSIEWEPREDDLLCRLIVKNAATLRKVTALVLNSKAVVALSRCPLLEHLPKASWSEENASFIIDRTTTLRSADLRDFPWTEDLIQRNGEALRVRVPPLDSVDCLDSQPD